MKEGIFIYEKYINFKDYFFFYIIFFLTISCKINQEDIYLLKKANTHYTNSGDIVFYFLFNYDKNNNLVKKSKYIMLDSFLTSRLDYYESMEYDINQNLVKKNFHQNTKYNIRSNEYEIFLTFYIIYKYNGKNQIIEELLYDSNGDLFKQINYKYDNNRNLIEVQKIDSLNVLDENIKYIYNNNNLLVKEIYNNDFYYTYEYDKYNRLVRRISHYENKENENFYDEYHINEYDSNGNKIKTSFYGPVEPFKPYYGSVIHIKIYKYDEKNNLIEESTYNSDNELLEYITYEYEFVQRN